MCLDIKRPAGHSGMRKERTGRGSPPSHLEMGLMDLQKSVVAELLCGIYVLRTFRCDHIMREEYIVVEEVLLQPFKGTLENVESGK